LHHPILLHHLLWLRALIARVFLEEQIIALSVDFKVFVGLMMETGNARRKAGQSPGLLTEKKNRARKPGSQ
jgi:hypothetical protein